MYMKNLAWEKCANMVSKLLTTLKKEHWMRICPNSLENIENGLSFLQKYYYLWWDLDFPVQPWNHANIHAFKDPPSPRIRKYKFKATIVFLNIQGITYIKWVPEDQRAYQVCHEEILKTLCKQVRRLPEIWKMGLEFFTRTMHQHTMKCSIASSSGKSLWSNVGFMEGSTLKGKTYPICNLFDTESMIVLWL